MKHGDGDEDDVWEGLRLTGVALASAFVTAAVVIAAGQGLADRSPADGAVRSVESPGVVRAALR